MKSVKARIKWLSPEDGGRRQAPSGPTYSTVAKFEDLQDKWPEEAWSIVAEFLDAGDEPLSVFANVRLLAPDGPSSLLRPGSRLELFEGRQKVADVTVLSDTEVKRLKLQ